MTEDLQQLRAEAEAAQKTMTPEEVKEHEKKLLRGVFDVWPEIVEGICSGVNDHLKEQVAILQVLDSTPWRVKAVRPEALRAAVEAKGMEAVVEVLERIDANSREMYRRAKRLRAEHDRLKADRDRLLAELEAARAGGASGGPAE